MSRRGTTTAARPSSLLMKLRGKSLDEVRELTRGLTHDDLAAVLFRAVTVEEWFKPAEIAELRRMRRQDVLAGIRAGKFGPVYFARGVQVKVPASGVAYFDEQLRVPVEVNAR